MVKARKHLYIVISLVIVLSIISLLFYKWKFDGIVNSEKQVFNLGTQQPQVIDIEDGSLINQNFEVNVEALNSISLRFATYEKNNNGEMNIKVKDNNGKLYYDNEIMLNQLQDNSYFNFKLNDTIINEDSKGLLLNIEIRVNYDSPNDKIALYTVNNDNINYHINDKVIEKRSIDIVGFNGKYFSLFISYILISCFIILGVIILYYLIFVKNSKLENIFLVSILFVGIVYMSIFTPFSIPDEPYHIDTSYRYSNVLMFKGYSTDDGKMLIDKSDYDALKNDNLSINLNKEVYSYVNDNAFKIDRNRETISVVGGDVESPFWMYLPQALGITMARILGLGSIPMLYLGKLFNLLVFSLSSYIAIKRSPICKLGFAIIALFPMTMHLVSSFSSDAIILGVSFLLVSECLYLMKKNTFIDKYDLLRMMTYSILLAPCKSIAYFPICFLCFIISKDRFQSRKKQITFYSIIIGSGALSFIIISLSKLLTIASKNGLAQDYYSLGFIFKNPSKFMYIVLNTFNNYFDFYTLNIIGQKLSWFSLNLNYWIVIVFFILFFAGCIKNENEKLKISLLNKCWIFVICLGVFVAVHIGMFIGWTKEGSSVIEGVQGRYLLPIVILIGILLRNNSIEMKKGFEKKVLYVTYMIQPFVFMSIFSNNF